MKVIVIGSEARTKKYLPALEVVEQVELVIFERGTADEDILATASDASCIFADAICPVSAQLIQNMPNLKFIQSEGVAFNAIDIEAARAHGVIVSNNKGVNASSVAEHTVMLMLACLRDAICGDEAVRAGEQIQMKERMMVEGYRELNDCKIGFIGAGDIAQATMKRLQNWDAEMSYFKRTRLTSAEEQLLGVSFEPLDDLLATSDIVSLHVPVTSETTNMVNAEFFSKMKPGALLINTARGEIVDQEALIAALASGTVAMAGLDTLAPEPVLLDNTMLTVPEDVARRIVFSPHVAGNSEGTFVRAHRTAWENIARILRGEDPVHRVS